MLDTLLNTLIRELQNDSVPGRQQDARVVARRFVRSVARIFVIFSVDMAPNTNKRRRYDMIVWENVVYFYYILMLCVASHVKKCHYVFKNLVQT